MPFGRITVPWQPAAAHPGATAPQASGDAARPHQPAAPSTTPRHVDANPPHRPVVDMPPIGITESDEHRPVAVLALPERAHYVTDEGFLIAPADSESGKLLTLRVEPNAAERLLRADRAPSDEGVVALRGALAVADALEESALRWAGEATEVVLVSDQDYRVTLRGLAQAAVACERSLG